MRNLGTTLGAVIALAGIGVGAGCSSDLLPGTTVHSSCDGTPPPIHTSTTSAQACELAAKLQENGTGFGFQDEIACPADCGGRSCTADHAYMEAFRAANPALFADAGGTFAGNDAGDAGAPPVTCPASADVAVTCAVFCEGRRTDGIADDDACTRTIGDYFASCAYLEAVSVVAFARMYGELAALGAPRALLERVERARREELRHVALTAALARRHGCEPRAPERMPLAEGRTLFAIALENAVEGCIRETWGAALAMVRAANAEDDAVRIATAEIARDEVGHAELAWDVAAWLAPKLSSGEREQIANAQRAAVAELARDLDLAHEPHLAAAGLPAPRERKKLIALLDERVFLAAA